MSQNDFTIANQGFPAFRADLNSALQALASIILVQQSHQQCSLICGGTIVLTTLCISEMKIMMLG